jgi:hypothetical protein
MNPGVEIPDHAKQRAEQRGATHDEVRETMGGGEQFEAKYGRTGFRRNSSLKPKQSSPPEANR